MGIHFNTAVISASESGIGFQQLVNAALYGSMYEKAQLGVQCQKSLLHGQQFIQRKRQSEAFEQQLQPTNHQTGTQKPAPRTLANETKPWETFRPTLANKPDMAPICPTAQLISAAVHTPLQCRQTLSKPSKPNGVKRLSTNPTVLEHAIDDVPSMQLAHLLLYWDYHRHA